jgi:hypothetical protein
LTQIYSSKEQLSRLLAAPQAKKALIDADL